MSVFLEGKARLIYENCPVRVIFNQANGMGVFYEDRAFSHMNDFHKKLIRDLSRGHFLLDITDGAIAYLHMRPSRAELARFGTS